MFSLIDKLSTDDESDGRYIITNDLKDIWDRSQIHADINARDAKSKIRERIKKTKNEWKGTELSAKTMGKGLHKVFKAFVN